MSSLLRFLVVTISVLTTAAVLAADARLVGVWTANPEGYATPRKWTFSADGTGIYEAEYGPAYPGWLLTTYVTWTTDAANRSFTYTVSRQKVTGAGPYNYDEQVSPPKSFTNPYTLSGTGDSIWTIENVAWTKSGSGSSSGGPVPPSGTGSGSSTAINQTISFGALANQTTSAGPITLSATASSGLPVTFTLMSGPATLSGNSLTLTGAGTVVVRASQAGNTSYNAAASVDQSFTVTAPAVAPVPAVPNYAPTSLSPNAVITFSGTTVDPKLGTSPDSSVIRVTSTTAFQGGTYTYTRTGATTAQLKYTAVTTSAGFTETETGTVNLTLSSATRGTYTSSGSYSGTSSGTPFSGTFTGSGTFTYAPPAGAPVVATQPTSQVVTPGGSATLSVGITSGAVTYQWQKDGTNLNGQTGSSLTLTNLTAADSGAYSALITNSAASILSDTVTLTVAASPTGSNVTSRLSNVSVLTTLAKNQVLTVGFTMQGGTRPVLVRAVGPSLAALGLSGAMPDPALTLYTKSRKVDASDDWRGSAEVSSAITNVGAFPFSSAGSYDSALVS